ncbi:hypothetical protein [Nocardiopsis alba]
MFSSGQDPYDPNRGGVPSPRGMSDFNARFEAMGPDAPMPAKVVTTRMLLYIGGACGVLLSLIFLLPLAFPTDMMAQALDEQTALMAEEGVEMVMDVETMRALMAVYALVTGLYGVASLMLGRRLARRTVGAYWGVVVFQGLAGLFLLWNVLGGGLLMLVPLGFTCWMLANMFSKEGRAHYGLL